MLLYLDDLQPPQASRTVIQELLGGDREHAISTFLMCAGRSIDHRIGGPWLRPRARVRRGRQDLQLSHRRSTLAVCGPQTVCTGVTSADNHHMLAMHVDG